MSAQTTYELTSDTQIYIGSGVVTAIEIITDGTNNAKAILYDVAASGSAAATNKLQEITVIGTNHYGGRQWVEPVRFKSGLWLDLTGTGASAIVEWRKG